MTRSQQLLSDLADQFERQEQPANLAWMERQSVTTEELATVTSEAAMVLRGFLALHPAEQIQFIHRGILTSRPIEKRGDGAETVLEQRRAESDHVAE